VFNCRVFRVAAAACTAEFEFDADNRVLSRDDVKRMSADLLLANQRRSQLSPTNQKLARRRRN